jgi:hypothetical protein
MIYESCEKCKGNGSFDCSCLCSNCEGRGSLQNTCDKCNGRGYNTCSPCSGSGRVLISKSWLFGEKYGNCFNCANTGKLNCRFCSHGSVQLSCSTCSGTGGNTACPSCKGHKKIGCSSCKGKGRFAPKWSKERIRAEIEKRRVQINEEQEALEYWYQEVKDKPMVYDGDFPGRGNEYAISRLREEIDELMLLL